MFDIRQEYRMMEDEELEKEYKRVQEQIRTVRRNPTESGEPIANVIGSLRNRMRELELEASNRKRRRTEFHVIQG